MKEKRYEAAYAGFVYEAPATHWTPSTVVRQRLTKMDFTKPDGIELGGMPIISDGQTALDTPVFPDEDGGYLLARKLRAEYKQLLETLHLPSYSFHTLRHTFATRALEVGMDYKTLSILLGHSSVTFTLDVYAHCSDTHKRREMARMEYEYQEFPEELMIIIRGLNKAFGEKIIFSNFNLEIPDGSFVVISGDSGSGKSTLLNMIGGIEKPDSGSIIIEGLNITRLKNKNSFFADTVGFLFQNFALLENKTVKENLSLIKKSSRTKVSLKEALNRVGLSKEVNKKVYQLSGGEQQRVALARLMMKKCSVVLADEPTGSLDKKNRDIVMRLLHELNEEGKTVIIVTHDQGIIEDEPYVVKI